MKNINKYIAIICFVIAFSVCFNFTSFAQNKKLTNNLIIEMIELGLSEDIILAKIKTSECDFSTSIDDIIKIKKLGVSDKIIVAIINRDKKIKDQEPDKTGIYIKKDGEFIKILPSVFSGLTSSTLANVLTDGILNKRMKAVLPDSASANIIPKNSVFYFYFSSSKQNEFKNQKNWSTFHATSPNQFSLLKLKVNLYKNQRELIVGKESGLTGTSTGISNKVNVPFKVEPIDEYSFRIITTKPLKAGEYGFIYQGSFANKKSVNISIFDFSIPEQPYQNL